MDFAGTESGESRQFVDNDDVQGPVFDIYTETVVLFTAVSLGPADDICVGVNRWLVVCVLGKLSKLVVLALWVLVGRRDTSVDADLGHSFCGLNGAYKLSTGCRPQ